MSESDDRYALGFWPREPVLWIVAVPQQFDVTVRDSVLVEAEEPNAPTRGPLPNDAYLEFERVDVDDEPELCRLAGAYGRLGASLADLGDTRNLDFGLEDDGASEPRRRYRGLTRSAGFAPVRER